MEFSEDKLLAVADLANDGLAMSYAVLARDYDEARFRAHMIAEKALVAGYLELAASAMETCLALGAVGTTPEFGFGEGVLDISDQIGVLIGTYAAKD